MFAEDPRWNDGNSDDADTVPTVLSFGAIVTVSEGLTQAPTSPRCNPCTSARSAYLMTLFSMCVVLYKMIVI